VQVTRARQIVNVAAVLAMALGAGAAFAQAPGGPVMKSQVKPGLYEQKTMADLTQMPGVPKGQEKNVETKQRCITQAEVDKGIQVAPGCTLKNQNVTGTTVEFTSTCRDGATHEMKIATNAGGFTADMKMAGNRDGTPFAMTLHSESRYLGPCKE
jgi:hypothetical protein